MNFRIAIDLSTTTSGVCYSIENNTPTLFLVNTTSAKLATNYFEIGKRELKNNILNKLDKKDYVILAIELANFKNAKLTQQFAGLAGMIFAIFKEKVEIIKLVQCNSNSGQFKIGCRPNDDRYTRKIKAKEFTMRELKCSDIYSQDECDAFCMWHFINHLKDFQQSEQLNKAKKKQANKLKILNLRKKLMIETKLLKLEQELKTLDATKNKKRIENIKKNMESLNNEKKTLSNNTN